MDKMSSDYKKGIKKIKSIVKTAIAYRNRRGYKENLGYDQQPKLESYLFSLHLTYAEKCDLITLFYSECRKI